MALPKQYSLSHQREFNLVKEKGKLYSCPWLGILVLADTKSEQFSRFGFLISRKVDVRAVQRNRIKRLLSESVQPLLPKIKKGFKIVFLPRPAIKEKSLVEVREIVEKLLFQADLL